MDCSRPTRILGTRSTALAGLLLATATGCPSDDVSVSDDEGTSTTDAASTSSGPDTSTSTSTSTSSSTTEDPSGSSSSGVAESSSGSDTTTTTDSTSSSGDPTSSSSGSTDGSSSSGSDSSSSSSTSGEEMESCPFGTIDLPATVMNSTAMTDSEFTSSCGGGGAPDVSYLFTAPFDGVFVFDTFGSAIDTILHVKGGTCGGPELTCD